MRVTGGDGFTSFFYTRVHIGKATANPSPTVNFLVWALRGMRGHEHQQPPP